jgi:hypothetical protein
VTTPRAPKDNLETFVALADSSGALNPTLKTNAGSVAVGQSLKTFVGKVALSASVPTTVTLETVTLGKTFFLTDLFLSHDSAVVIDTRVQANGVDIFRAPIKGDTAPASLTGIESQPSAAAGQLLTILYPATAGPPNGYFNLSGFEQ